MLNQYYRPWAIGAFAVAMAWIVTPARADFTVDHKVSFVAAGKNPWGAGDALVFGPKTYPLLDIPYTHVDIPPINANPAETALNVLGDFLGVDLPDVDLLNLEVGGSISGQAYVNATVYASAGQLDVNYPGSASLSFQTDGVGGGVQARNAYSIGSAFQPGVTQVHVTEPASIAGPGYNSPALWSGLTMNTFNQPKFKVRAPWADAKIEALADINAGVYAKASALYGTFEARKDFSFGGPIGGTVVQINPSGLYVWGQDTGLFSLTEPLNIPINGIGTAIVSYPNLNVASDPSPPGNAILEAHNLTPIFQLNTDLEKLIPVIGPILHNTLGPVSYDLAHISLAPTVSIYQDMTLTPNAQVRLKFSEMVLVDGQLTRDVQFPLGGAPIHWTPIFTNSDHVTISPTYTMNATFRNETGLDLSAVVDFDALGFDAPFLPEYVGPLIDPPPVTIPIGRLKLIEPEFSLPPVVVTGSEFTLTKYNSFPGLGDIRLTATEFLDGSSNSTATFELHFERSTPGSPPHQFQANVPGFYSSIDTGIPASGEGNIFAHVLTANQDVVFVDPVTSEHINLGRVFGLYNTDLSPGLTEVSPSFVVEDPEHPGQFLPPLYVPYLDAIPYTPVDVPNHPILGGPLLNQTTAITEVEYGTEVVQLRDQPLTSILVRSPELTPEGDARFGPLSKALINNSGAIAVQGSLNPLAGDGGADVPAMYLVHDGGQSKLVREGDPTPGGGHVQVGSNPFRGVSRVSDIGVVAFSAHGADVSQRGVYLGGLSGVSIVARHGQSIPSGGGFFNFTNTEIPVAISGSYDAAFVANWSNTPGSPPIGSGVFRGNGTSVTQIAEVGVDPLGNTGIVTQLANQVDVNDSGYVSFLATTTLHPNWGVYRGNGPSLVAIALPGGAAPFGATFQGALPALTPRINSSGQVAFVGNVLTSLASSATAVYRGNGAQLTQIALAGQFGTAAPDQDGVLSAIQPAVEVDLNDAGQVAFFASVAGAASYNAIFRGDGANLTRIIRTGQPAPDGDGTFQYLGAGSAVDFDLNNHGHVAFYSDLISTAHNEGLFLYDGVNVVQVIRSGQALAGSTVTAFSGPSLNDEMQVAYTAHLADGRDVAARFEPRMYWHNPSSGAWGGGANWSLRVEPVDPYDVFIVAENPLTVTGPSANRAVKSISIGGPNSATATLDLVSGATLATTNITTVLTNGVLSGYGALAGEVVNDGAIRIGGSGAAATTTMLLNGDVTLEAGGKLEMDLKGTTPGSQFDRLAIAGEAHLDGELALALSGGFNPTPGNVFQILTAGGSMSGQFDMAVTQLPSLAAGLGWLVRYHPHDVSLQVIPELPGDFNANGHVGLDDHAIWLATFGSTTRLSADADGDHDVDGVDFLVWQRQFGASSPFASASEVPEPTTSSLVVVLSVLAVAVLRPCLRHVPGRLGLSQGDPDKATYFAKSAPHAPGIWR